MTDLRAAAWGLHLAVHGVISAQVHHRLSEPDQRDGMVPAADFSYVTVRDDVDYCREALRQFAPALTASGRSALTQKIARALDDDLTSTAAYCSLLDVYMVLGALAGADLPLEVAGMLLLQHPYVEAPGSLTEAGPTVFLAGGISGCVDWHTAARLMIGALAPGITVVSPKRAYFDPAVPDAEEIQVAWEHEALRRADVVLMWLPLTQSDMPIAMFESGYLLASSEPFVIGADSGWHRYTNIKTQLRMSQPDRVLHESLEATVRAALKLIGPKPGAIGG